MHVPGQRCWPTAACRWLQPTDETPIPATPVAEPREGSEALGRSGSQVGVWDDPGTSADTAGSSAVRAGGRCGSRSTGGSGNGASSCAGIEGGGGGGGGGQRHRHRQQHPPTGAIGAGGAGVGGRGTPTTAGSGGDRTPKFLAPDIGRIHCNRNMLCTS